jgi:DNA-binding transcriptional regulator YdaS (Cro superfamily)
MKLSEPMTPKQVVKYYGSQSAAARELGYTRAAVSHWVKNAKRIPYAVQYLIQHRTNGALKAE